MANGGFDQGEAVRKFVKRLMAERFLVGVFRQW
jgi:hypothetical protein